jgi:mitochondrial ribosomal protein L12
MNVTLNRIKFIMTRSPNWAKMLSSAAEPSLQPPASSNADKVFSPKLVGIVDQIEKLTLLEVSELNSLLKQRLKIPDTPVMAMGAMPMAAQSAGSEVMV